MPPKKQIGNGPGGKTPFDTDEAPLVPSHFYDLDDDLKAVEKLLLEGKGKFAICKELNRNPAFVEKATEAVKARWLQEEGTAVFNKRAASVAQLKNLRNRVYEIANSECLSAKERLQSIKELREIEMAISDLEGSSQVASKLRPGTQIPGQEVNDESAAITREQRVAMLNVVRATLATRSGS